MGDAAAAPICASAHGTPAATSASEQVLPDESEDLAAPDAPSPALALTVRRFAVSVELAFARPAREVRRRTGASEAPMSRAGRLLSRRKLKSGKRACEMRFISFDAPRPKKLVLSTF
eukprot:4557357-Pleurochrysis_carterae.AAC.2